MKTGQVRCQIDCGAAAATLVLWGVWLAGYDFNARGVDAVATLLFTVLAAMLGVLVAQLLEA